ncbi:NUDIX domain-containing protein [Patescibacteria group bacterium]|nr:NUDIX domain-containing protein [Patescibacteria group bacterium]
MSLDNHALYQVATKALLFKDNQLLVLITPDGYLDFPGGRVDESERDLPWTEALKREVAEELGEQVSIEVRQTLFVSKRQYHKDDKTYYIAAIFFKCKYVSGGIELSDEHANHKWLTPEEIINNSLKFVSEDERNQLVALFSPTGQ